MRLFKKDQDIEYFAASYPTCLHTSMWLERDNVTSFIRDIKITEITWKDSTFAHTAEIELVYPMEKHMPLFMIYEDDILHIKCREYGNKSNPEDQHELFTFSKCEMKYRKSKPILNNELNMHISFYMMCECKVEINPIGPISRGNK